MTDTGSPAHHPARPLRVLVVDDYPDAATATCELMRALGHKCEMATDGAEALARAAELEPDLVVLDIGMPDLSGYDVARRLRTLVTERNLVLVALTGSGLPADIERAAAAGFDHHVVKPANLAKVQRLLALAQQKLAA